MVYGSLFVHFVVITALISIALHNVLLSGGEASMACLLDEKNPMPEEFRQQVFVMFFKRKPAALSVFVVYQLTEYVAYEDVHLLYACGVVGGDYDIQVADVVHFAAAFAA